MKKRLVKNYKKEELDTTARKLIKYANIVVDIGCGITPQEIIKPTIHICCEPYLPYIQYLQRHVEKWFDKNYVFLNITWQDLVKILPQKSVDTIFLKDVIEHVEKNKAKKLLKETEKIAKQQIIIFTPLGFIEQHHKNNIDAWGMKGGKWQEHKSGWYPDDFDSSWKILVSKDYHGYDNQGNKYEIPKGAMWAIKTFPYQKKYSENIEKTKDLHKLFNSASEMKSYKLIRSVTFVFLQIKKYRDIIRKVKYKYF